MPSEAAECNYFFQGQTPVASSMIIDLRDSGAAYIYMRQGDVQGVVRIVRGQKVADSSDHSFHIQLPTHSLAFLMRVIDSLEEPVFVKDSQHRWIILNEVYCRLMGRQRDELLGKSDYEFFPVGQADVFWREDDLVFSTGETRINDESITWHGEVHTIRTTKTLYVDPESGEKYIVGTIRDKSTPLHSLEALIGGWVSIRNVLEQTMTVLFEQDTDLRYVRIFNTSSRYPEGRFKGKTDYDLFLPDQAKILHEIKHQVLISGQPAHREVAVTFDGVELLFDLFVSPKREFDGSITGVLSSAQDVTGQRAVQRDLESTRQRFLSVFEAAPIPIILAHPDGVLVDINPSMQGFLGYTRDELIADGMGAVEALKFLFDDAREFRSRSHSQGKLFRSERRFVSKDGGMVWGEVTSTTFYDHSLQDDLCLYMIRDITAHRLLIEQLRARENILSAVSFISEQLLEHDNPEDFLQMCLERLGRATDVSRVYLFENEQSAEGEMFTTQRYEWVNEGISPEIDNPDLQHLSFDRAFLSDRQRLSRGEAVFGQIEEFTNEERKILEPQGILSLVQVPVFVDGLWWGLIGFDECTRHRIWSEPEVDALSAAARTIGAAIGHKRAVDALRRSEMRWRSFVDNDPDLVAVFDEHGNVLFLNHNVPDFIDSTAVGASIFGFLSEPHSSQLRNGLESARTTGRTASFELQLGGKPGSPIWLACRVVALGETGDPERFLVVGTNVTELSESRARFQELAETTNAAILIYQEDRTVYVNPAAAEITGYSKEELLGLDFWHIIHPEHHKLVGERARARQLGEEVPKRYEVMIRTKTGETRWLDYSGIRIFHNNKPAVLGTAFDVTERKLAEQQSEQLTRELRREKYALERVVDQIEKSKREYKGQVARSLHRVIGQMLDRLRQAAGKELRAEIDAADSQIESILGSGSGTQQIRFSNLTTREREICRLIQDGASSKEIASRLNLSVMTIHKHRERIRRKLGLTAKNVELSTFLNLNRDPNLP
jgi:PAS domain S-box-containing protein